MVTHDDCNRTRIMIALTAAIGSYIWVMRVLLDGFASCLAAWAGALIRYFGCR